MGEHGRPERSTPELPFLPNFSVLQNLKQQLRLTDTTDNDIIDFVNVSNPKHREPQDLICRDGVSVVMMYRD
jgi:hypothetical protein